MTKVVIIDIFLFDIFSCSNSLSHFSPMLHFCIPWKSQKTKGDIKWEDCFKESWRFMCHFIFPAGKISSKFAMKTLEQFIWCHFNVFIENFQQALTILFISSWQTFSRCMSLGWIAINISFYKALDYTFCLIRKSLFCLNLNFLNIMLEIRLRFFEYFP